MKHEIVNVTLNRQDKKIIYPIFVGQKILSNSGYLLKQYIINNAGHNVHLENPDLYIHTIYNYFKEDILFT